jgi:hypothetical protein
MPHPSSFRFKCPVYFYLKIRKFCSFSPVICSRLSADSVKAVATECIQMFRGGGTYSTLTHNVACGRSKVEVIRWRVRVESWGTLHGTHPTPPLSLAIFRTANLIVNNRVHCVPRTSPTRLRSSLTWNCHSPSSLACLFNVTLLPR